MKLGDCILVRCLGSSCSTPRKGNDSQCVNVDTVNGIINEDFSPIILLSPFLLVQDAMQVALSSSFAHFWFLVSVQFHREVSHMVIKSPFLFFGPFKFFINQEVKVLVMKI